MNINWIEKVKSMDSNFEKYKLKRILNLFSVFCANLIIMIIYLYILLIFFDVIPLMDNKDITLLSTYTIFLLVYVFVKAGNKFGMSAALFAYLIFTQFGMSTIYYLFGPNSLSSFSRTTLNFLNSGMYNKAIILGLIASISYVYGSRLGSRFKIKKTKITLPENEIENKLVYYTGLLFLILTLLYLLFFILSGRVRLGMSYHSYLNSGIVNSLYSWILFMYSIGICFVVSVSQSSKLRLGWMLFSLSALIFFSTGNRGEVLYATLAAMGIMYYKSEKLKFKYIFFALGLIFLVIPFIRNTRNLETINSLDFLTVNTFDAIAEMGHQLRLSVLILEEFSFGAREYLFGFSYYNPVINLIDNFVPWSIRLVPPSDFNFESSFSGLGFSQVAESYANFGILGVISYHFFIAFMLRKAEARNLSGITLAYWGAILAILINATRNRFAFVVGQLFVLTVVYAVLKIFSNKKNIQ